MVRWLPSCRRHREWPPASAVRQTPRRWDNLAKEQPSVYQSLFNAALTRSRVAELTQIAMI